MQHKMMNFMMIFMGFLFYHVPAGLCVYFIASSLWGMGERKLLDIGKKKAGDGSQGEKVRGTRRRLAAERVPIRPAKRPRQKPKTPPPKNAAKNPNPAAR